MSPLWGCRVAGARRVLPTITLYLLCRLFSEKRLHHYLAEFDFRYSNRVVLGVDNQDRADKAIRNMVGKRLTYRKSASLDPNDS